MQQSTINNAEPQVPENTPQKPLGFFQVLGSSLMAALGVQSNHIRERDFTRGHIVQFILSGVLLTVCFLLGLLAVVNLVV